MGDFNGDGKLDLALTNDSGASVSILLGTGMGTFGAKTDFVTGDDPISVAVGDFNGDGYLDLAVVHFSNTVSILLGTGTGSFGAKTDFGTGIDPHFVAVGDFNGDGKLDLAVANAFSNTISILLGTGTGSFGAKTDFGAGGVPRSVAVGDFNGDGKLDLAVANDSGAATVSILLGTGAGSFGAKTDFSAGTRPYSVALGDFNGDGKLDLVVANLNSNTISILLGTGTGSFGGKTDYGTGANPDSVAVGDFNGDGRIDLAVANNESDTVSILLNNTPPSITVAPIARTAGNLSANSQIALVNDAQNAANTLSVTVNGGTSATVNGVTVTLNPTAPNVSGQVFADIVAACAATTANFTLRVTDSCGLFTEATLTVTVTPPPAQTISPTSQSFTSSGGTDTANVTSQPSCPWTALSNDDWITITSGASGSGNGTVNYSVAVNNSLTSRTGTMTIAGQTFTVTQSAPLRIDTVTPPAGRVSGAQQIKLAGSFANLSTVTMGGVSASFVFSNGTIEITVTTPAHAVGAVDIVLTPTSGSTYTKTNAFAYLPATFTDDTLVVEVTTAKAQHIIELRQAVDALRAVAGLGPAPWGADPVLTPFNTVIKAIHILELRSFLENAAAMLGYPAGSYTDPVLNNTFQIKRVHIEELRQRVRTIAG